MKTLNPKKQSIKSISHCHVTIQTQSVHNPLPEQGKNSRVCAHYWPHLPLTEVTGGGGYMGCGLQSLLNIGINIFPDTQTPNSSPQTQIAGPYFYFILFFLVVSTISGSPFTRFKEYTGCSQKRGWGKPSGALSPLHTLTWTYVW